MSTAAPLPHDAVLGLWETPNVKEQATGEEGPGILP